MSGVNKAIGTALLNTLTCNDGDMYNGTGEGQTLYTLYGNKNTITSSIDAYGYPTFVANRFEGKVEDIPSEFQINGTLLGYTISNAATPSILTSYIGLLVEAPQYYIGSGKAHPQKTLVNRENPIASETKSFLNIHEIPNRDHGGLLSNASAQDQHYWDGYARVKLSSLTRNSSTGKYECDYTILTGAQTEEQDTVVGNYFYTNTNLITKNTSSIFMGLNTSSYAWPAIKHFGLFKNASDAGNLYLYATSVASNDFYWIETTPDLYMWGELQENDNWYHETSDTTRVSGKVYYVRSGSSAPYTWTVHTGDLVAGTTYYEQLGVIIEPDYGATFSPNAFKLIFENSVYEV